MGRWLERVSFFSDLGRMTQTDVFKRVKCGVTVINNLGPWERTRIGEAELEGHRVGEGAHGVG